MTPKRLAEMRKSLLRTCDLYDAQTRNDCSASFTVFTSNIRDLLSNIEFLQQQIAKMSQLYTAESQEVAQLNRDTYRMKTALLQAAERFAGFARNYRRKAKAKEAPDDWSPTERAMYGHSLEQERKAYIAKAKANESYAKRCREAAEECGALSKAGHPPGRESAG